MALARRLLALFRPSTFPATLVRLPPDRDMSPRTRLALDDLERRQPSQPGTGRRRPIADLRREAARMAATGCGPTEPRQLLVDVSGVARTDLRTGIQRVARAQVLGLLHDPPPGYRAEPVFLQRDDDGIWRYRYAASYVASLLGSGAARTEDVPIDTCPGDVLYLCDYFAFGVDQAQGQGLYRALGERGVRVSALVYDLLPMAMPQHFPADFVRWHERWLTAVATCADQLICISDAVAHDLRGWIAGRPELAARAPHIVSIHLGADIEASAPTAGIPPSAARDLERLAERPTFLMVGSIDPRKGQLQALAAFDRLWRAGVDVNLAIVGAEGWTFMPASRRGTIPEIVRRLRTSPESGRRLFWFSGVSDDCLEAVYRASTCLLAPSEGEGFGLPVIEAASRGLPIVARDLPVFRELAGEHAWYFTGLAPEALAESIVAWLECWRKRRAPTSAGIRWSSWRENVDRTKAALVGTGEAVAPGRSPPQSSNVSHG